ncbi:MAG: HEAT repeat domain-containing protein [Planctomycetota bacterium]|jgi:hypothetical protein
MRTAAQWSALALAMGLAGPLFAASGSCGEPKLTRDFEYWRGAYEKTPGPFLCRKPDVTDLVVTCDRWPDCSDLRRFCLDAIRLSGAKTEHEKALAVWQWMRRAKTMTNGQPPMDPFNPDRDGGRANCPIKVLNVYSAHFCSGLARVHALMWRSLGYRGEKVSRGSHGMAGLFYEDHDGVERSHIFDCNFGGFTMDRAGKRVLTMDEFSTDLYMWMHIWYFNEPWPMPTHRVELSMRRGEGLKRIWGNWGKPFHNNVGSEKYDRQFRQPSEKGPYPITYGNGLWTYSPDLSSADWAEGLAEPPSGMAAGRLQPAAVGKPGVAVWHFRTPYIAVESEIEMKAFRKSDADKLKLHLSLDGGKTWKECWSAPAGQTGKKTFTAKLDERFEISSEKKTRIPEGFHAPFGRYAFRLKLELQAAGAPEDCRVEGITFRTTVHQAIRALPQLWPGRNRITVRGKLAEGAAVRVTYVWDDPKGKGRRNVTVAEKLPYSYEIIAAGKKWEDCVCRDFIVETIPATGKGSRTEVREEPSEIEKLPPLPAAADTRCRWGRPRKNRMTVDQCVQAIESGDKRRVKSALVWIAELADPKGFDAARKVAFDRELCKGKGTKTDANLAMYKSDPEKARPVLKEIMADVKNSPWRGGDDMKYAGGAWISGACMIGQMAAESGWKEFVPVMCKVLESPYCKGSTSRMSILRSMCELVEPGDQAAIEAVRKCLKLNEAYVLPHAALAAGRLEDKGSVPRLRELLDHPFMVVRRRAAIALGMLGDNESAPRLRASLFRIQKREVLDHVKYGTEVWMDEFMRAACAQGLGLMKDKPSLPTLKKALADEPVPWVRKKIEEAIKAIGQP